MRSLVKGRREGGGEDFFDVEVGDGDGKGGAGGGVTTMEAEVVFERKAEVVHGGGSGVGMEGEKKAAVDWGSVVVVVPGGWSLLPWCF